LRQRRAAVTAESHGTTNCPEETTARRGGLFICAPTHRRPYYTSERKSLSGLGWVPMGTTALAPCPRRTWARVLVDMSLRDGPNACHYCTVPPTLPEHAVKNGDVLGWRPGCPKIHRLQRFPKSGPPPRDHHLGRRPNVSNRISTVFTTTGQGNSGGDHSAVPVQKPTVPRARSSEPLKICSKVFPYSRLAQHRRPIPFPQLPSTSMPVRSAGEAAPPAFSRPVQQGAARPATPLDRRNPTSFGLENPTRGICF